MHRLGKLAKLRTDGEHEKKGKKVSAHNPKHTTLKVGIKKAHKRRGSKKAI